jgi:type I restriction enzyme S subunit
MELKPGYKQTEVGVIPEDWNACKLGRLLQFQNGRGFQQGEWSRTGLPIIRIQNLNDSEAEFNFFNGHIEERHLVQPGDLLFAWSGTVGSSFGPRIWRGETGVLNQHIFKVSPFSKTLSSPYALRLLESSASHIASQSHGFKASFVHVKKRDLEKIVAAFPPCQKEQKRICEALADIDAYLDATEVEVNKKRDIKQAAMQELLSGKRRLPGFEGEWEEVSLGSVAMMNSGGTPPTGRNDFYGGGIPWVSISDMTSGGRFISETERTLSDLGLLNCAAKRFPAGTILYAMYASLGECSVATCEVTTSQAILGIRPSPSLIREYLYYYLCSIHGMVKQLGQQGTQSNLNKKIVQGFTIKLPKQTEQIAIANILSDIDQDIDMLNIKAEKARAMKTGMMQQLLTGKIRLK